MFKISWNQPKCILMTWDEMMPVDGHQCNTRHSGKNQFQAALLWEGDSTVLFTNYEDIQMPLDCVSKRYAMVRVGKICH
ncbi:Oidioi.mRNA.OKI2018_I69.XSR.g13424.t1.cds [Oikopleura dioica]|uniref:Oidioi.mRNA.OKI2018_I69.XSR.g13424.t1.cds n=1 Tax=Oikopleura dioica TaxID=34765 RepID=A0ABN7SC02_OIKDI|nr:Oidioi.mRNA.OKI2018_I69.XSR.g13424.t1.cds [Oikopleura dioica]